MASAPMEGARATAGFAPPPGKRRAGEEGEPPHRAGSRAAAQGGRGAGLRGGETRSGEEGERRHRPRGRCARLQGGRGAAASAGRGGSAAAPGRKRERGKVRGRGKKKIDREWGKLRSTLKSASCAGRQSTAARYKSGQHNDLFWRVDRTFRQIFFGSSDCTRAAPVMQPQRMTNSQRRFLRPGGRGQTLQIRARETSLPRGRNSLLPRSSSL